MERANRIAGWLAALALVAAVSQVGLGARFSPSGEQLGTAVPVASLALGAAFLGCAALWRLRPLPAPGRAAAWLLAAAPLGLLGLPRAAALSGVKELVQVLELTVLAAYVVEEAVRRGQGDRLVRALGILTATVLALDTARMANHPLLQLSDIKAAVFVVLGWPFLVLSLQGASERGRQVILLAACLGVGAAFGHGGLVLAWLAVYVLTQRAFRPLPARLALLFAALALLATAMPALHARPPWAEFNPRRDAEHLTRTAIEARAAVLAPRYYPLGGGPGRYKTIINQLKPYQPHLPHPADLKVPRDGNCQYLLTLVESGAPAALALLALLLVPAAGGWRRDPLAPPIGTAARIGLTGALAAGLFGVIVARGTGVWIGALLGLVQATRAAPGWRTRLLRWAGPALAAGAAVTLMALVNRQAAPLHDVSSANRALRTLLFREQGLESMGLRIVPLPDTLPGSADRALRVEGEDAAELGAPFEAIRMNDTSGGKVLSVAEGRGKDNGFARFALEIPADGFYSLYAHVHWQDGCSNSLLFELGDQAVLLASDTFGLWHTLEGPRPVPLRKGTLTVTVRNPEDGIRLDYWGLRRR